MTPTQIKLFTAEQHASERDHVSHQRRHTRRVSCLPDLPGALTGAMRTPRETPPRLMKDTCPTHRFGTCVFASRCSGSQVS